MVVNHLTRKVSGRGFPLQELQKSGDLEQSHIITFLKHTMITSGILQVRSKGRRGYAVIL